MANEKEVFESLFGAEENGGEAVDGDHKEGNESMTKVNWKQKLSSRKLWAAVLCAVFALVTAFFGDEISPEAVGVLEKGIYGLIAYIFGEGAVDVAKIVGDAVGKSRKEE